MATYLCLIFFEKKLFDLCMHLFFSMQLIYLQEGILCLTSTTLLHKKDTNWYHSHLFDYNKIKKKLNKHVTIRHYKYHV
jgi:hypothetical protein